MNIDKLLRVAISALIATHVCIQMNIHDVEIPTLLAKLSSYITHTK